MVKRSIRSLVLMLTCALTATVALAQNHVETAKADSEVHSEFRFGGLLAQAPANRRPGFSLMPAGVAASVVSSGNLPVVGSGTLGRLTRWTGFTSTSAAIGDSNIFEDKFGKVGIGTVTPASLLTVQGVIETTLGGIKFPDGTTQTSSAQGALFTVAHDTSLTGAGTAASPLAIAVAHDATLAGNGTATTLLGIAVPLALSGEGQVVQITSTAGGAATSALVVHGGDLSANEANTGISAFGGNGTTGSNGRGGTGVFAQGGFSTSFGGVGIRAQGAGAPQSGFPGVGIATSGGSSGTGNGASGIEAFGGDSVGFIGGAGISAFGASAAALNAVGGAGIIATGGQGSVANGFAGIFIGNVDVQGNLSKSSGSFKIDHPLDPENKYLYHSFVESPDMMNIYNGVVMLDETGEATVALPDWFQALNKDYRYSLTAIGAPAPYLHIGEEVNNNHFRIAGGTPGMRVSWQVTGIRQDAYAKANRIQVEVNKVERERGTFLHPEVFNQPAEKSVNWVTHQDVMEKAKEAGGRSGRTPKE